MLAYSMTCQWTIYHWVRDHRVHHKHSDTKADPHDASRGFFFSHIGWLVLKKDPAVFRAGEKLDFADIEADPIVMWQHKAGIWFSFFMTFLLPMELCHLICGENRWYGFLVAGCMRFTYLLHVTSLVNSLAHYDGDRP